MPFIPYGPDATPRDVNSSQIGQGRHGGTGDRFHRGEFATVLSYQADSYSSTVRTERGRTLNGVPKLRSTPGELSQLPPGTEVLISYEYGTPIIMGVLTTPATDNLDGAPFDVTGVSGFGGQGDNRDTLRTGGNYRQAQEPTDLMPGDNGFIGEDGNSISVLNGGVNVMRSSPLAQVRTHLINDLVEIFSRNFRHVTDMGEFSIFNDDGRINMKFRGASDQRSEAGPDEENWTVRMDLGAEGDLFNFELTTPQGQTLFRLHVDSEGAVELYGVNGVSVNSGTRSGGSHSEEHTGSSECRVKGNRSYTVEGDETDSIQGNHTEDTGSDYELNVGNDCRIQALRDIAIGAGRNVNLAVQGGEGDNALSFDIEDGNWSIDIGSPTSPNSAYKLSTHRGNIDFETKTGGDFRVTTRMGNVKTTSQTAKLVTGRPDSVVLGGENLVSHLVKWEELQQHLTRLYEALDRHVHVHQGTAIASGMFPVAGLSGPPAVPIGAPLVGAIPTFRSSIAGVSS